MAKCDWRRVSKSSPCPVCGGPDNCTISSDGSAVWCGRVQERSVKQNDGGQFLHLLQSDDQPPKSGAVPRRPRRSRPKTTSGNQLVLEAMHQASLQHPDRALWLCDLAAKLGVRVEALDQLKVGVLKERGQYIWLFPEFDSHGKLIGLQRRYPDGKKLMVRGSERGLTLCGDGYADAKTIYIVEGASDCAALMSQGICVIGRPSNSGGVKYLIALLAKCPGKPEIIVVGENDRKPHEHLSAAVQLSHKPSCTGCCRCWPGRSGAESVARQLRDALQRKVQVWLPPESVKDIRELLLSQERTAGDGSAQ